MKVGKNWEMISLDVIFLQDINLAFEQGCVDFLYPLYMYVCVYKCHMDF